MIRSDRRKALLAAAAAAVAVAVLVPLLGYVLAGDVPRGTTVLGIDVGGRSREGAVRALSAGLGARAEQLAAPVAVSVGDVAGTVQPADVGLGVDVAATIDKAAAGRRLPFGSQAVDPVVQVDDERLAAALAPTAAKVSTATTPPAVTFDGLTPKPVYPKAGKGLDPRRSADAFTRGWLREVGKPIVVPVVDIQPPTTASDVDRLVAELAAPAVAAPVTVTLAGRSETLTVPPKAIAASLVLAGDATTGTITPRVDEGRLRAALADQLSRVEVRPKNAQVADRILTSSGGRLVDTAALATDLLGVLPQAAPRSVAAAIRTVEPATSAADLSRLGIKDQVASFTTRFTGGRSANRSRNIIQIAQEVDGAIVRPGQTFSLNGHTGPRGYAEGYTDAPVIYDGKLVPGVGGGVSQFTTTLFNAIYYAGLQDVFHQPHGYYFSRYPSVIESTIFYPTLDFKFRNDSSHGVLLDTAWTDSSVTVSVWSTKRYDITTEWGPKRDIQEPTTERIPAGPSCIATEGSQGFTQDAWRIFRQGGKEVKREKFSWTYDAEPRFICS